MSTLEISPITRSWWVIVLYGILSVAFGIIALVYPLNTAIALAWVIGIFALAEGTVSLIAVFSKDAPVTKGWLILYALLSILFGGLTLINPATTAAFLLIYFAFWLVLGGIFRIIFAIRARKELSNEWMIVVSAVLAIILGIMLIARPITGMVITTIWIGAMVLVYGIFQVIGGFKLRKL